VRFLEEEAVLVLVLLVVFVAVFLLVFVVFWLVVALFFLSCAFLFIYRFDGVRIGRCRPGLLGSMSHRRKGQCSKK